MVHGAENDRVYAFDYLKAVAVIAVVFTHAGADDWRRTGDFLAFFLTKGWTVFHVPSFLFISGYLYARPTTIDLGTVWVRLGRVLLPYVLASVAAQVAGVTGAGNLGEVLFQLLTASSVGVYYYIFLFAVCILLMWPLSRLDRRGALVLWCVYVVYSVAVLVDPMLAMADSIFWTVRDPLQYFAFGFFLSGWVSALWREEIVSFARRRGELTAILCVGIAGFGLALCTQELPFTLWSFDRALYTFGVIGLFVIFAPRRPAGPVVRFLADATFAIYLYHVIFQSLTRSLTTTLPAMLQIAVQVSVGLGGASLVVLLSRRLLGGTRARRWVGA
jgi:peptidoglycan/LPS O-acetylase OafA/YrhL